jgi:two-component system sensor histidine kinase KdpD
MPEPDKAGDGTGSSINTIVRWVVSFAVLLVATIAMRSVRGALDKAHIALVYLLIVLGASAAGGRTLGFGIAGLAFLGFDFLFLPPFGTFTVRNPLDWLVLVAFLVTSIVATQLLYRANATAKAATERAVEVDRLAALGAETLNAADAYEALGAIADVIRASVDVDACVIYLRGIDGRVVEVARATRSGEPTSHERGRSALEPGSLTDWIIERGSSAVELADGTVRVANDLRQPTGIAGEDDAAGPGVRALALPLQVRENTVGVLRLSNAPELHVSPEQARLLTALAYYAALGAERARLVATAERAEAERRVERLRSALLTAVSHDLRTPLTTIKGLANEILHGGDVGNAAIIEGEADRLNALVSDLLDLSRIHAGALRPTLAVNTVDDLLGAALRGAAGTLRDRRVDVDLPDDELLAGIFDFSQTLRVLVNLLDNAAKYSSRGTAIDIRVRRDGERLMIDVMDRGPGVPESERERIFESFYRPPDVPPDVRGHGLGLAIARGLAEAQGGTLRYSARSGGGSVFTLELPAAIAPSTNTGDDESSSV